MALIEHGDLPTRFILMSLIGDMLVS